MLTSPWRLQHTATWLLEHITVDEELKDGMSHDEQEQEGEVDLAMMYSV